LLGVNRSSLYYQEKPASIDDVELLNRIRDQWRRYPFYGYRKIAQALKLEGLIVNHKRVQRLMRKANIRAIAPGPNTSKRNKQHIAYPYLLRDVDITYTNQVWMVDITYLRLYGGFVYLTALVDVYSRYVVGWAISNTLDTLACLDALKMALAQATPNIINSDQGCQFTSEAWIESLKERHIKVSMTGKGRCLDNIYIERFWRSFKYEEFYLNDYQTARELKQATKAYIKFYNDQRLHQSLDYKTPAEVYLSSTTNLTTMRAISPKNKLTCGLDIGVT